MAEMWPDAVASRIYAAHAAFLWVRTEVNALRRRELDAAEAAAAVQRGVLAAANAGAPGSCAPPESPIIDLTCDDSDSDEEFDDVGECSECPGYESASTYAPTSPSLDALASPSWEPLDVGPVAQAVSSPVYNPLHVEY